MRDELLTTPPAEAKTAAALPPRMSEVEKKPMTWLVPDWIVDDGLTILFGDPGIGKTFLWCSLAADLSRGEPTILERDLYDPPKREPKRVLFFSKEDPSDRALVERLEKAGADLENVRGLGSGDRQSAALKFDSQVIEDWVKAFCPHVVIFDPVQSFLPKGLKSISQEDVREALAPVVFLANEYHLAVLVIAHSNKKADVSNGRELLSGSGDFYNAARAVIYAGQTGEMFGKNAQFFLSLDKSNYAQERPDAILGHVQNGAVVFDGVTDKSFNQLRREYKEKTLGVIETDFNAPLDLVKERIVDTLESYGDMKPSELERAMLEDFGTTKKQLRSAKESLIAEHKLFSYREGKQGERGSQLYLSLERKAPVKNRKPGK